MGVILQVALPSRVLAAARLQCGAAGAGASRGLGVCAEHARLAARGESARAMEIGDFLGRLGSGRFSQCAWPTFGIFSEPPGDGGRHVALDPLCCGEDEHSTAVLSGALLPYPSTTAPAHPPYPSLRIDPAQPHLNSRP